MSNNTMKAMVLTSVWAAVAVTAIFSTPPTVFIVAGFALFVSLFI